MDTPLVEPTLKLYWATGGKIQRGDLDGSNIEDVVNREAASIALDAMNGKIYWTHADDGIYRANLSDGTNIEHLVRDNIWSISGGRIALVVDSLSIYPIFIRGRILRCGVGLKPYTPLRFC